jgi:hypothetical protein
MAADTFKFGSMRVEIDSTGAPVTAQHDTEGAFTDGNADWFTVDDTPVAIVGSSGPNTSSDHTLAKVGKVLVPLDTTVRVLDGSDLLTVDDKPAAMPDSTCQVPDAMVPIKSGVIRAECEWFLIDGKRVVRGRA